MFFYTKTTLKTKKNIKFMNFTQINEVRNLINLVTNKTINKSRSKELKQVLLDFAQITRNEFSVKNYAITILFPYTNPEESWLQLNQHIQNLNQAIRESEFLVAYTLIGIEIHRGRKSKNGDINQTFKVTTTKQLRGNAHLNINIAFFNDILAPSLSDLSKFLNQKLNITLSTSTEGKDDSS